MTLVPALCPRCGRELQARVTPTGLRLMAHRAVPRPVGRKWAPSPHCPGRRGVPIATPTPTGDPS